MLTNVKLVNFKSHRSTELNFDDSRLHALVGQNSSGKTSILQAVYNLSQLTHTDFRTVFTHENSPEFIATTGTSNTSVTGNGFSEYQNRKRLWKTCYEFEKGNDSSWSPFLSWEIEGKIEYEQLPEHTSWDSSLKTAPSLIVQALKYAVNLKLVSANLAKAFYSEAITPRVKFDGSGLAPTLDYLRNET
ncbi:AAA family ATPase, partial [Pseudanabaenaceae cyanobacterium LEGE 13415]|nr:AAA family ATPase [Pseudanabaenaceae cyanobacterium LEGE 13415]